MKIKKVSLDTNEKAKLIKYLIPHEKHVLFILGNLLNSDQDAHIYIAHEDDRIIGVCGYYPLFHSCSLFSESEVASSALIRVIHEKYSFSTLLGMKESVAPAYEELVQLGKKIQRPPEQNFFELDMKDFIPHTKHIGIIRPVYEKDTDEIVRLLRHLHSEEYSLHPTEDERKRVRALPVKFCLEVDGTIVSSVSSNGLCLKVCQILGVITDPAFRRKGCAQALCSHMIAHMKEEGARKVVLFTDPENDAATRCYVGLGFRITGTYYLARFYD